MIIPDGMSDKAFGFDELQTPLQLARTPQMDELAAKGQTGLVRLCRGYPAPESAYTLLSLFGMDAEKVFRGSAAMKFIGEGNQLDPEDVCLYCTFVTEYEQEEMRCLRDLSGELSLQEKEELLIYLKDKLDNDVFQLCAGRENNQYVVWKQGEVKAGTLFPPSVFPEMPLEELIPKGDFTLPLMTLMQNSVQLLKEHPVNSERLSQGKPPVTGLWIWGAAMLPDVSSFEALYGMKPIILTDSFTACGLASCMQAEVSSGGKDYPTMGERTAKALGENDFVILITEQPMLHSFAGDAEAKRLCIEELDETIIGSARKKLEAAGEDYTLLIVPSVTVSVRDKAATADFVPYLLYRSNEGTKQGFCEKTAFAAGNYMTDGRMLMEHMMG